MKNLFFDGRIGKDAEVKTTKNGRQYMQFVVANDTYTEGEKKTEWITVSCFDDRTIEAKGKYLTKGTYVLISGYPRVDARVDNNNNLWVNQYVTAATIDFGQTRRKEDEDGESAPVQKETAPVAEAKPKRTTKKAKVEETVSTFTPETQSDSFIPTTNNMDDDELPF